MSRSSSIKPNSKGTFNGGARPGAGRPKGSGQVIKIQDLILELENETNMPYAQRLAINYSEAIQRSDWNRVENYDRAFMNKMIADKNEIEVTEPTDALAQRQQAFAAAIAKIASGG
jgi:hypothetical protein